MSDGPRAHDPLLALRNRDYRAFAIGFLLSGMGLQMLATGIGWEIWERTKDELMLGYIGLARALPVLVLALPAGQAADVFDRRIVLFLTQVAFAVCCALLTLSSASSAPLWVAYTLLVLTGCARSCNAPARNGLVPLLVGPGELHNAMTWNSALFQFAAVTGPLLGGLLIDVCGAAWPVYAATTVCCAGAAVQALRLRPRPQQRAEGRFTLASMTAGAGFLLREKTVLATLLLDLFAVLLGGATALMPVFADRMDVGAVGLGALRAAPYVGAFLMALLLAHRPPFVRAGRALLLSVAGFGVLTIAFGLSTWFPLSLLLLAGLGALDNISVVVRSVLVQVRTPDDLRGRVNAVNSVCIESSNELGAFESGLVARLFGPVASVVSGGIGTIAVVLGIAWLWPEVRRLGRLEVES